MFLALLERLRACREGRDDGSACFHPLFLHCLCNAYIKEGCTSAGSTTVTLGQVRAAAAERMYSEKPQLRSVDGLCGQVQYLLGDALTSADRQLASAHFAQYRAEEEVYLRGSSLFVRDGRDWQLWVPFPQFPSPQEDPLFPLLLGGCSLGSKNGHPAPFQLTLLGRTTCLISAAALLMVRDRGLAMGSHGGLSGDKNLREAITVLAVISASRAHGVGGIAVRDFLLHLAAELQAEVSAVPLKWEDPTYLDQVLCDPDEVSGREHKLVAEYTSCAGQDFTRYAEANVGVMVVPSSARLHGSLDTAGQGCGREDRGRGPAGTCRFGERRCGRHTHCDATTPVRVRVRRERSTGPVL